MSTIQASATAQYDALRDRARAAKQRGALTEALEIYDEALAAARQLGEQARIDVAFCNRSGVATTLGDYLEPRAALREVLMRRACVDSAFLAAYVLARSHELTKEYKKGLFYARAARNHAEISGQDFWLASSFNLSGNCLLGDSQFDQAAEAYQMALELIDRSRVEHSQAGIRLNLGYAKAMLGDLDSAFELAFGSLRAFRRMGAMRDQGWAHLDLCHAYLERERNHRARRHGLRALAIAVATADLDLQRNSYFLLGEVERADGDVERAYAYFEHLQPFYPDVPNVAETMLAFEMRQLVNLRA